MRYENLVVSPGEVICDVHWWGLFSAAAGGSCAETNLAFQITFYNDVEGSPGSATCSYQVVATVTPTGLIYGVGELLCFSVDMLNPCCDTVGRWISIQGVGDDSCWFRWMSAAGGAGDGLSYVFTDGVLIPQEFDLSLCLTTTPTGACCQPDGSCTLTRQLDCTGAWQGAQTTCDPNNPCPQPTGACCQAGGVCALLTAADCELADGQWYGADVTCAQAACPPPCTGWELRATDGPSARGGHAMAYDSARGVVVLYGGDFLGETWEWDGIA
ncbi:MAG: hypothetical protein PHQ28_17415, partial [Mycobacterium sp.]|nr:hypothetical protein [Mycobacterium sp.]